MQLTTAGDTTAVVLSASSVAGLRALRQGLGDALAASGWAASRIGDAQLVLAEIATNAFVHDGAREFRADATCSMSELTITTRHPGSNAPPPAPASAPPPSSSPGGRGLVIVDELCASRDVSSVDGVTSTVVTLFR